MAHEQTTFQRTVTRNGVEYAVDVTLTRAVHMTGGGRQETAWGFLPAYGSSIRITPAAGEVLEDEIIDMLVAEANR
jgi:hypothetical protein